jgi:hypothetical protein
MGNVAIGTIVAKNFLPFARVLARSVRTHHPEVPMFVVLVDETDGMFDPTAEPFEVIPLDALGIPDLRRMRFRYSRQQVSIAAKPHLLRHLLDLGFAAAVFLDADILVLGPLDPLFAASLGHAVVLTPHLLGSLSGADRIARELNILQSGVYNGGLIGVSQQVPACRFLSWWEDRLHTHCRHAVSEGMHYDQRWLDLVPAFFDDVCILRDVGCNVAYWNLPEREVQIGADRVLTDGAPCRFFHFSGFDPGQPETITTYSCRLTTETIGPAAALFDRYVRLLEAEGYQASKDWPYTYESFDNGVRIPNLARRMYLEMEGTVEVFGDPFQTAGNHSYFHWLNEPIRQPRGSRRAVTRLWDTVYQSRPDLKLAFPDIVGADHDAYLSWMARDGIRDHAIPEVFLPQQS